MYEISRYILNIGMSYILFQRNFLVIHSSSISYKNHGILFIGDSGLGKSSIAYSFLNEGHELISEDFTPINIINGTPHATSSIPIIKLDDNQSENKKIQKVFTSKHDPLNRAIYKINTKSLINEKEINKIIFLKWGKDIFDEISKTQALKYLFRSCVRYLPPEKFPDLEKNQLNKMTYLLSNSNAYIFSRKKSNIADQYKTLSLNL